jgi:hypothetical protein
LGDEVVIRVIDADLSELTYPKESENIILVLFCSLKDRFCSPGRKVMLEFLSGVSLW